MSSRITGERLVLFFKVKEAEDVVKTFRVVKNVFGHLKERPNISVVFVRDERTTLPDKPILTPRTHFNHGGRTVDCDMCLELYRPCPLSENISYFSLDGN